MNVDVIRGGRVLTSNLPYSKERIGYLLEKNGIPADGLPAIFRGPFEVYGVKVLPAITVVSDDGPNRVKTSVNRVEESNRVVYTVETRDMTEQEKKSSLRRALAEVHDRYEAERFNYNNVFLTADMVSVTNVRAVVRTFEAGNTETIVWRGKASEIGDTVAKLPVSNLADAQALETAFIQRIGKGFAVKEAIEAEIDAGAATADNVKARFDELINA